jgi:RNA polymerase sigma-70 factor (ECF subfamily)
MSPNAEFPDNDDFALLSAAARGDGTAFEHLVHKYSVRLVGFLYRFTGERSAAEDLSQETFLKLYKNAASFRPEAKFTTLLYSIAAHTALDAKRRTKARPFLSGLFHRDETGEAREIDFPDNAATTPLEILDRAETGARVQKALSALPEQQRMALLLKVYEDRPYSEIAEILGVTVPAVESLLFRARQNLRTGLSELILK